MILDLKEVEGGTWYPWYWRQMYHLFAHCPPSPLGIILILSLLLWCMACISRSQMLNADAVGCGAFHFSFFAFRRIVSPPMAPNQEEERFYFYKKLLAAVNAAHT